MTLTNGAIDASLLVPVPGTSLLLREGPLRAWLAACAEVQRRYGWTPTLTDAYRSLARQVQMLQAYYDHTPRAGLTFANGGYREWGGMHWWRKPGMPTAATPGGSNHGWGTAVDVADLGGVGDFSQPRRAQFAAVAGPLGWSDAEGRAASEPWHWTYTGPVDTVSAVVAAVSLVVAPNLGTPPAPIVPVETDMFVISWTGHNRTYTVIPGKGVKHHADGPQATEALRQCRQTEALECSDEEMRYAFWNNLIDLAGQDPIAVLNGLPQGGTAWSVDVAGSAQTAGLLAAIKQISSGQPVDLAAVTAAAEAGAKEALAGLTLKAQAQ